MSLTGSATIRPDGHAKVTGATRYIDDQPFAGWHGATVRDRKSTRLNSSH